MSTEHEVIYLQKVCISNQRKKIADLELELEEAKIKIRSLITSIELESAKKIKAEEDSKNSRPGWYL